jgi:hypothetical protein
VYLTDVYLPRPLSILFAKIKAHESDKNIQAICTEAYQSLCHTLAGRNYFTATVFCFLKNLLTKYYPQSLSYFFSIFFKFPLYSAVSCIRSQLPQDLAATQAKEAKESKSNPAEVMSSPVTESVPCFL